MHIKTLLVLTLVSLVFCVVISSVVYAEDSLANLSFEVLYEITIDPSLRYVTPHFHGTPITPSYPLPPRGRYIFSNEPVKIEPFLNFPSDELRYVRNLWQVLWINYFEDKFREIRYFPKDTVIAFEGDDFFSKIFLLRFEVCSISSAPRLQLFAHYSHEIVLTAEMVNLYGLVLAVKGAWEWFLVPVAIYLPASACAVTYEEKSSATVADPRVIRFEIGNTDYTINGISHTNDVVPFIDPIYNRTMIPLRAVSEALGAETRWISQINTVNIVTRTDTHQIVIDMPLSDSMGIPVNLQGRVFVPVRYVAEILGATTRWDGANSAVYIYQ